MTQSSQGELDRAAAEVSELRLSFLVWGSTFRRAALALLEGEIEEAEGLAREALTGGERSEYADVERIFPTRRWLVRWEQTVSRRWPTPPVGPRSGSTNGPCPCARRSSPSPSRSSGNPTKPDTSSERLAEAHPSLGEHPRTTVRTGTYSSYTSDPRAPITWQT